MRFVYKTSCNFNLRSWSDWEKAFGLGHVERPLCFQGKNVQYMSLRWFLVSALEASFNLYLFVRCSGHRLESIQFSSLWFYGCLLGSGHTNVPYIAHCFPHSFLFLFVMAITFLLVVKYWHLMVSFPLSFFFFSPGIMIIYCTWFP